MAYKNIQFKTEEGVGILTINRPKALNALNTDTIKEIRSVLADVKADETVKVLIITGAGEKAFGAGADIGEIKDLGLNDGFDFMR
jgi:enoyl-CoA hydratase